MIMRSKVPLGVVLSLAVAAHAHAIELVRGGKPVAAIVVAAGASKPVRYAAEEFQAAVATMSGARLPIATAMPAQSEAVVLIGAGAAKLAGRDVVAESGLKEVRDDGYSIRALAQRKPELLVVVSHEPRGTIFGVYDLLERFLKCGFFCDGDQIPRNQTVAFPDSLSLVGNPEFAHRPCYVATRFYGPKRFHATLWNPADWRAFLRWMAAKKLNCLALSLTGETRAWGEAFQRAFPETKRFKTESRRATSAGGPPTITARMGWGLHPSHRTAVLKEALGYARETLGMQALYVLAYGQFEQVLQEAQPNLPWLPATPASALGTAGQYVWLKASAPKCQELQARLWETLIKVYGRADRYLVLSQPLRGTPAAEAAEAVRVAKETLTKVDPGAAILASTEEQNFWGQTAETKIKFLNALPKAVSIFYMNTSAPEIAPFHTDTNPKKVRLSSADAGRDRRIGVRNRVAEVELFAGRPYWYGCAWGGGSGSDLFENHFPVIYVHRLHHRIAPEPKATGFASWTPVRGVNPAMEHLCAEFAWRGSNVWRGEGSSQNPHVRRYFLRRYGPDSYFNAANAFKAAIRGAPLAPPGVNYRAFAQWAGVDVTGEPTARDAVAITLANKAAAQSSPFYEPDLADYARNYLFEYIYLRYGTLVTLVRKAGEAARGGYPPELRSKNLEELQKLETEILRAHKALARLVATRKDMCLDEVIREATATPNANKNLARAIREHQSGVLGTGRCLVDTIEYHQQLKAKQIRNFLDYAKKELTNPTAAPIPSWDTFFLFGTREFIDGPAPTPYDQKAEKAKPSEIMEEFLKQTD